MKSNPQFLYEDLKNINLSQIPPGFKNSNFRGDIDGGYLCEIRLKVKKDDFCHQTIGHALMMNATEKQILLIHLFLIRNHNFESFINN